MRIVRSIYHFALFLIVSWTVYYTLIFIALPMIPFSDNEDAKRYIFDFWNIYLLGALDFSSFIFIIGSTFSDWTTLPGSSAMWCFSLYLLSVNGLTAYIWCNYQSLLSASFLALTPCIAGPFPYLLFCDGMILAGGMIGLFIFYIFLYKLNAYRKKHFPNWTLPAWLEWRRPNMVPPKKPITAMIAAEYNKYKL